MISLNKKLSKIRCNRYQYLIKKGSMSNYSFDIVDEEKTGILNVIFEETTFPIEKEELKDNIMKKCKNLTEEKTNEFIKKLEDIELLVELSNKIDKSNIMLITDNESSELMKKKLLKFNYNIKSTINIEDDKKMFLNGREIESLDDEEFINAIENSDYIMVLSKYFQPDLFYKVNYYSVKLNKKMIISYLDGDEGIIVPIMNPNKSGCYNDFEMLRESSFHNLLDYQIMKEDKIIGSNDKYYNQFYFEMLMDYSIILLNSYDKYSYMISFAYSLDFERMVTSKIRLLKFPKCPSCQGDSNLTHPFI